MADPVLKGGAVDGRDKVSGLVKEKAAAFAWGNSAHDP
jgi:hypothetical protein